MRNLVAGLSVLLVVAASACGAGDGPDATATPPLSPLETVETLVDALNAGDAALIYENLSSEARQDITLEVVESLIASATESYGAPPRVTIAEVEKETVSGDLAELDLTLSVQLGDTTVPLQDVASLVLEDGAWRISDHFLQTALVTVGLAPPAIDLERKLGPDGCLLEGDPMAGVYAPTRLQILEPCVTVVGVVNDVSKSRDGDITFRLELTGEDLRLLNDANYATYGGPYLQVEIVPADQERLVAPEAGDRVAVTGPWVLDAPHGHNEIHPAFKIELAP